MAFRPHRYFAGFGGRVDYDPIHPRRQAAIVSRLAGIARQRGTSDEARKVFVHLDRGVAAAAGGAGAKRGRAPPRAAPADKGEAAAIAECKAKSDPSILVNYWKTAAPPAGAARGSGKPRQTYLRDARRRHSRSYTITGNAGPMKVTGTACSLAKPFAVKGSGGGMCIAFSYAPAGEAGGAVSYTGGGTGSLAMVRMAGKGTYTVTLDDKGGTLTETHTGAVTNPAAVGHAHRHLESHADGPVLAECPQPGRFGGT